MSNPVLDLAVHKRVGEFALDVDVECRARVTGLFGPSGGGKTTLLNCLAGLSRPDGGHVRVDGRDWFRGDTGTDVPVRRRRVGYVFQDSLLFDHMTVRGNISYGRRRGEGGPGLDEVVEVLGLGGLLDRRPREISGGERRRVAIARAVVSNPALLLFDEPLTGLDAPLAGRVLVYLKRLLTAFEIPAVYVSHSISDVLYVCDDVVVLREGRVAAQGPPPQVITQRGVLDDRHLADLRNVCTVTDAEYDREGGVLRCRLATHPLVVYGPLPAATPTPTIAVRACDLILARQRPQAISARNVLPGVVERVAPVGGKVLVFVDLGETWIAEVGRAAVEELDLRPGAPVFVIVKASAIQVL